MLKSFLFALFLIQAAPPQPVGIVSGLVRGADGKPAEGMRVFAIALRDASEAATGPTIFEVLAQTDASGRYRLEVPPGRYYIACGSVAVPTYYPGTTSVADARPVTIAAGAQVNGVDFADFVAPSRSAVTFTFVNGLLMLPPSPATTISGMIRLLDGSPAKGMEVVAIPVPRTPGMEVSSRNIPFAAVVRGRTDDLGGYLLKNVAPGSYYIVSGTKDIPTIFPGTPDVAKAVPVQVTAAQPVDGKNFAVAGVSLGGRVTAAGGSPALGAWIRVHLSTPRSDLSGPASLMFGVSLWETSVDGAGSYSVGGLSPGSYIVEAGAEDLSPQVRNVAVGDQGLKGIDFSLPVAAVSGRLLFEDGSLGLDARAFGGVVFSRTDSSGLRVSTILPVSEAGTFGNLLESGEYQVQLPSLPVSYSLKSITAGTHDLLKELLKVTTSESVTIEIRLEQ